MDIRRVLAALHLPRAAAETLRRALLAQIGDELLLRRDIAKVYWLVVVVVHLAFRVVAGSVVAGALGLAVGSKVLVNNSLWFRIIWKECNSCEFKIQNVIH